MAITTSTILILFLASCSHQAEQHKELTVKSIDESTNSDLSTVIGQLLEAPVDGYVLIHESALEHSSIEKAREDTSAPQGLVRFETQRLDLHTPADEKSNQSYYHWGSPLVFRQVIADHGDVVEVNTMDQDLPEPFDSTSPPNPSNLPEIQPGVIYSLSYSQMNLCVSG